MWPWEHAAVGYLALSAYTRARGRRPTRSEAIVLLVGTQFPDLVDKPLAWAFDVLPSGTSLAHSVFVAVPLSVALWLVARRLGHPALAVAFGIGYLLHLPADAIYSTIIAGTPPSYGAFLWPLGSTHSEPTVPGGLLDTTRYYLGVYRRFLSTPRAVWYVIGELLLLGGAAALWVADGRPGLPVRR